MMKRWLLAVSVVALTAGGAYAQNGTTSPAQSPAAPPAATMPAPGATGAPAAAPKATHAATHAVHASAKVKQAQEALQAAGLYKGKVDGVFGPQTKAAVKEFQKANGLKPTARLDSATMKKLSEGAAAGGTKAQ